MQQSLTRAVGLAMFLGAAALAMTPEAQQASAARNDLVAYGAVLALVALLARIGLLAWDTTRVLRRTIDFQAVVANAANRLLACRPEETSARLVEALAILGQGLSADHCYVLMFDGQAHLWSRPGLPQPPGWPATQGASIADVTACPDDLVFVEATHGIGPVALLDALTARGVTSWACARLRRDGRIVGLLCFERCATKLPAWPRQSRGFLQMVCDSFGAALEREHAWAERRETESALRRAQRLEAIGTFTSGIAHNINNVLTVMLGHAEIISEAVPPGSHTARQIELLVQAGGRAREIASQILEFGRQRRATTQTSMMDEVVAETVAQITSQVSSHAGGPTTAPTIVRLAGTADGAHVGGEPAQLQQVLLNLLRNAAQASTSAAEKAIDIRLDRLVLSRPQSLSHGELPAGDHVRLTVTDAGCGMDEATMARIFEPFFTTRSAGTGLGLATAFQFVQEHGGAFDVRSAPGIGSTFKIWLPVVPRPAAGDRMPTPTGTLMVVGPEPGIVRRDEETLAALGFEPIGFADPEAALAALRTAPERFDLLIVEARLADGSGGAFARRAVQIVAKPIILSLESGEPAAAEGLSSIPVVDTTCRPWRSDALSALLSQHLAWAASEPPPVQAEAAGDPIGPSGDKIRDHGLDSRPTGASALIESLRAPRMRSLERHLCQT